MRSIRTPSELFDLSAKTVVLTGASSGLGARWAPVLGAAGAQVVLCARREEELKAVAANVPGALAVVADVTSADDRDRLVETAIESFGTIDVLINNAGTAGSRPAVDTPIDEFRTMIDVDLTAVFAVTQAVALGLTRFAGQFDYAA